MVFLNNPNKGPLIDYKHYSLDEFRKMTPEQIKQLPPKSIGYYQLKDIHTDNGFDEAQVKALYYLKDRKSYNDSEMQKGLDAASDYQKIWKKGGRKSRRKTRKCGRKSRKCGRKSRKGGRKSRK